MEPQRPETFRLPASPTISSDADQWIRFSLQPLPAGTIRLPGIDVIPIQFEFPLADLLVPGSQPHVYDLCAYDDFFIAPETCLLYEVGFRICIASGLVGHVISHPTLRLPPACFSVEPFSFLTSTVGLPRRQGMAIEISNNSHRLQVVRKGQRLVEIYFSRIQPVTPYYWGLLNPPPVHRRQHPADALESESGEDDISGAGSGSSTPPYYWNEWVGRARQAPREEDEPSRTSLVSLQAILDAQDPYYPDEALVEEVNAAMERLRTGTRQPADETQHVSSQLQVDEVLPSFRHQTSEALDNEVMLISNRIEEHGGIHSLGLIGPESGYATLEVLDDDHTYEDMEFDTPITLTPGDSYPGSPSPTWDEPPTGWEDYWATHWRGGRPGDARDPEQVVRPQPQLATDADNPRLDGGRVDLATPPPPPDMEEFPPLPPPRKSGRWAAPAVQLGQLLRRLVSAPASEETAGSVDSPRASTSRPMA